MKKIIATLLVSTFLFAAPAMAQQSEPEFSCVKLANSAKVIGAMRDKGVPLAHIITKLFDGWASNQIPTEAYAVLNALSAEMYGGKFKGVPGASVAARTYSNCVKIHGM